MKRRDLLLASSVLAALALTGCASAMAPAAAQTRITEPPPAPLIETIPPAPDSDAYWIPGHWRWNGQGYAWLNGYWERARPGMVYQQAYWSNRDGYWIYHPGQWVAMDAPLVSDEAAVVYEAPPPPRVEVIPPSPGPTYVWISGFWGWSGGHYAWRPGYWSGVRIGYTWAPGHWVRHGRGWHLAGGFWVHR